MSCRSSVQYYICIQFPLLIISYEHIINRQIINTLHFDWNICCSCTSHNLDLAARPGVSDNSSPNQQAHCPLPLCAPCILWQQEIKIRWSTTLTWRLGQVSAMTVPKSASLRLLPSRSAPCSRKYRSCISFHCYFLHAHLFFSTVRTKNKNFSSAF